MRMKSICHRTATIGAAQVIDSAGNAADVKAHSAWVADMINAAESSERDTNMHKRWQILISIFLNIGQE